MNYMIVDDDADFAARLKRRLESSPQYSPGTDKIYTASAADRISAAAIRRTGVWFLDILFRDDADGGISLASRINGGCPEAQIIYITSYLKYASAVYDTEHAYLIYKPELDEQFEKALQKALDRLRLSRPEKYAVTYKGSVCAVSRRDILYIEQHNRICTVVTVGDRLPVYKRLDEIFSELDDSDFYRCHKSFVVNLRHVATYDGGSFIMDSGDAVKISRAHLMEAREAFAAWCAHSR